MKRALTAPNQLDQQWAAQNNRVIELEFNETYRKGQDVEIPDARLILHSPNGNRWSIVVSNAGVISATAL